MYAGSNRVVMRMSAGEIAVANGWTVGSRRHASGWSGRATTTSRASASCASRPGSRRVGRSRPRNPLARDLGDERRECRREARRGRRPTSCGGHPRLEVVEQRVVRDARSRRSHRSTRRSVAAAPRSAPGAGGRPAKSERSLHSAQACSASEAARVISPADRPEPAVPSPTHGERRGPGSRRRLVRLALDVARGRLDPAPELVGDQ